MYFELGCELAQGEAQAQNTSKNDDLENGPIFVFDFFVESTYLDPNKAGMCLVLVDNFSEQPVEVRVLCSQCCVIHAQPRLVAARAGRGHWSGPWC